MRQLVQAHAYWRLKGLAADLVIWNEDQSGYRQVLQDEIMGVIALVEPRRACSTSPGGIFVRRVEQMSEEDRVLMQTVARVIISRHRRHARRADRPPRRASSCPCRRFSRRDAAAAAPVRRCAGRGRSGTDLVAFNGLGGFTQRRPRVRHHDHARAAHARAVGQRARQPVVRHASSARAAARTPGARTRTPTA